MKRKWNVIHVKESKEMKVALTLSSKEIENFCPVSPKSINSILGAKMQNEVLLPSYIFVSASEEDLNSILKMRHVIGFVFWKSNPVELPDEYIQALRVFSTKYQNISLEKLSIHSGFDSKIIRNVSDTTVELVLPAMGYRLSASKPVHHDQSVRVLVTEEMKGNKNGVKTTIQTGT